MRFDSGHPRSRFALTVAVCFLVAVVEGYDLQILSAIGPLLRGPLHLDHEQLGFIFSSSLIGLAIGATLGGHWADRVGRKRVIVWSAFGMCLFTFGTAFAVDFWSLFLGRILTGLAIGGAMPNTIVMVDAMTERRSAGVVTLMMCGIPAGGIVAALVSRGLAAGVGWRGVLVFGGAFALLTAVVSQLGLTASTKRQAAQFSRQSPLMTVLLGEGRALMTSLLWLLSVLSLAVVALLAVWLPTLVVDKGLPATAAFSTLLAWNVGGVFGVVAVGRLCDRLGARNTLVFAYLAEAVLFVLFAKGSTASTFMVFAAVVNFFVAGAHYTVYGLSPRLYPPEGAGAGVGAALATGRIGSILGPTAAGMFLNSGSTGGQVILGLTPIACVCAACVVGLVMTSAGKLESAALPRAADPSP